MEDITTIIGRLFGHRGLKDAVAARRERLYRLAWSWCRDPALAEDLAHDTIDRALASLEDLRDPQRLDVWLTRILVNRYRDHRRRAQPDTGWEDDRECPDCERPDNLVERLGLIERTQQALARLAEDQRQVITLVDLEGFSYAETARILGVPTGTVMSRLSRARQSLRRQLQDHQPGQREGRVIPLRKG
jgi:RNA polymerase sigma-70 factor (ECF subfamily)